MTDFDNTNRGALFRDDRKTKETDRDYSGSLNVFWRRVLAFGLDQNQQERCEIPFDCRQS
jgi:hypothetical protein